MTARRGPAVAPCRDTRPRASLYAQVAAGVADRVSLSALRRFEQQLHSVSQAARLLPAVTPRNAASERQRMVVELQRGDSPSPRWQLARPDSTAGRFRQLDALHRQAAQLPAAALHQAKLEELELDLSMIAALGDARRIRPLAARRFGTGDTRVQVDGRSMPLSALARNLLDCLDPSAEARTLPAQAPAGEPSLQSIMQDMGLRAGLDVEVKLEPRLAAGAASGERTVYIAQRRFGEREAVRLSVHEILGHIVSAANGRLQPMRLLQWGTAGSFADQEGTALYLEHCHGLMDDYRLRTLAGRVLATDMMHALAGFGETAQRLHRREGFNAQDAVAITERAFRGGGVARDAGYLLGFVRVRDAVESGAANLDELRCGRVSLQCLPSLRELSLQGLARPAHYRANFARSLSSTSGGTMPFRSPPRAAASLIKLELTKK